MTTGRRAVLAAGLPLLAGCGFHPLLAPGAGGRTGATAQLRTVYVGTIPERFGQMLRLALQSRLEGSDASAAKKYELIVPVGLSVDPAAIQRDTSTTRYKLSATCSWSLVELTPLRPQVTTGYARVLDGYDVVNQQYLGVEFASEDANRRIVNGLADQVVQQLATYFDGLARA